MTKRKAPTEANNDSSSDSDKNDSKIKKERADNWVTIEVQTLHKAIESRRETFFGKPDPSNKKSREEAWRQITNEVNAVSQCVRTVEQVMKKYKNEKCRAKRKLNDGNDYQSGKDAQNSTQNSNGVTQSQYQIQQHMTSNSSNSMPSQSSINVVKLASAQNVAKPMIDLPGHVQQILPGDDMVFIMPDVDISTMNIVSDGQRPNAINNQHNHHAQHTIQAINTGQGVVNGNHMMTRAIQSANMCSLVYSSSADSCTPDHHMSNNVATSNSANIAIATPNSLTPNLMHHRGSGGDTNANTNQAQQSLQHQQQHHQQHQQQPRQQSQHHQQQHHHLQQSQQHQPQQQHQQQQQQHQQQTQHQQQQQPQQTQHQHQGNAAILNGTSMNLGDPQVKQLLFNVLLNRDNSSGAIVNGQQQTLLPVITQGPDYDKQRNDSLAVIATTLTKIEAHLSKLAKVATSLASPLTPVNNNNNNQANNNNILTSSSASSATSVTASSVSNPVVASVVASLSQQQQVGQNSNNTNSMNNTTDKINTV
ncbi:hypothetical protein GZH46_02359 [Fragariocoptes setiger]|uniref:Regulatory protein zeste n=1 Tax=Fragariocoptes setiger TaxID=1670756 RepID=A0ABQ7S6T7_9ACAR|nr:hypothetical protein GZH46_02359 [Fragariocoptes setiger]